jgi:hypothetical protein
LNERWPSPTDPHAFESLCADLWGAIWGQAALKNGRNGQPQAGVDIYGRQADKWIGIQCKQKDELLRSKLTLTELAEEVGAARRFVPPLSRFIVATTGPADAAIQEAARRLTEEHVQQGLFEVEVWSWTDIWAELNRRPALLQVVGPIYWPQLFLVASEKSNRDQTEQILQAIHVPLLPCGLFLTLKIEATDEDLARVYGDQLGFHKLVQPPSDTDGRHFLGDCYLDVKDGAVEAAGFFRLKHPGYNMFHRNVVHTVSRFNSAKCRRPLSGNEPLFLSPQVTLGLYRGGRPRATDTPPTLVLKSGVEPANFLGSCALDNTVLVDYEYPPLTVSPPDAAGFSITSLRGSFILLTLDFFYIRSIAWLAEQSWPQLHNLQILLGSRRHALTFSLDDLSKQVIRLNPSPIARGDAVMPQIIFECEIDPEKFEQHLISFAMDRPHPPVRGHLACATIEPLPGLKLDSKGLSGGRTTKDVASRSPQIDAVCSLCEQRSAIDLCSVVPEYLFPDNPQIPKEHILCSSCLDKMAPWDDYGKRVALAFPEDLTGLAGRGLMFQADYGELRLWLLSLLWRMSVAKGPAWLDVHLMPNDAKSVRALLVRADPGLAGQYPVGCVLPSFDSKHLDFSCQPDCVGQSSGRLIRAAFRGILFFFWIREDAKDEELEPFYIRPDQNWIIPVVDWKNIDFLRHWVEELRGRGDASRDTT